MECCEGFEWIVLARVLPSIALRNRIVPFSKLARVIEEQDQVLTVAMWDSNRARRTRLVERIHGAEPTPFIRPAITAII